MRFVALVLPPVLFVAIAVWLLQLMDGWIRDALAYAQEEPK